MDGLVVKGEEQAILDLLDPARTSASERAQILSGIDTKVLRETFKSRRGNVSELDKRIAAPQNAPANQTATGQGTAAQTQPPTTPTTTPTTTAPATPKAPAPKTLQWTKGSSLPFPAKLDPTTQRYKAVWAVASVGKDEGGAVAVTVNPTTTTNKKMVAEYFAPTIHPDFLKRVNHWLDEAEKADKKLPALRTARDAAAPADKAGLQTAIDQLEAASKGNRALAHRMLSNLHLHEETHVKIAAAVARAANKKLGSAGTAALRQKIVTAAQGVESDVNALMDSTLHLAATEGSPQELKLLKAWIKAYPGHIAQEFKNRGV